MADLKDKINYITNQFSAGKPAFTGESSSDFLIGVMNELSSDDSNYTEFKNSIPALYKAVVEELNVATPDTKHILVHMALKNAGITSTLKQENITQKPIFVDFLIDQTKEGGNDALHDKVTELMDHAFDEKNKRIEVSSLINITHTCISKSTWGENDVVGRYLASEKFDGVEYAKFFGAVVAFNEMDFDYDLTENQEECLKKLIPALEDSRKLSKDEASKLDGLLTDATEKYSKFFFSNDLDIESQLHKVRAEDSLALSAGMISGNDLGTPIKDVLKEQAAKKAEQDADEEKNNLMMSWDERYNSYLKKLGNIKVMSSGDKFKKRFEHHGFAPSTAKIFGDSVVSCDSYGDPVATLWNISPLTGSMKLSRDMRYDDVAGCQQAFAIAALNARRQGWDSIFLNHPGPDREAKAFIENSFKAMIEIGDYNFEDINVPRRYQHVLDKLILDAANGTLKNNADVTEEVRNAPATKPEQPETDAVAPTTSAPATPSATTPSADTQAPVVDTTTAPVAEADSNEGPEPVEADEVVVDSDNTYIPPAFEQTEELAFDVTEDDQKPAAVVEPEDEFEAVRNEEKGFTEADPLHEDNRFTQDDEPERFNHDHGQYTPSFDNDEAAILANQSFDIGEMSYEMPEDLLKEQKASLDGLAESSPTKPEGTKKATPGRLKLK